MGVGLGLGLVYVRLLSFVLARLQT